MHGTHAVERGVGQDVHGRIAGAHHQHALALDLLLRLDVVRMQHLAVEGARIGGQVRLPMMSVGDDETGIESRAALALERDPPAAARLVALGADDARVEGDARVEVKCLGIGAEIGLRLCAAYVMRPRFREVEVRIARQLLGGVEIGRSVDRVRAVGVPEAADIGERLEAVEGYAALGEGLGHRKTRRARAHDAITLRHVLPTARNPHTAHEGSRPLARAT